MGRAIREQFYFQLFQESGDFAWPSVRCCLYNTDTLIYKLWQILHDTPERAAQPNSHTQQPNAKALAHAQLSNEFRSMPNVTSKEQKRGHNYGTDTIHTDKHTKRCSHTTGPATCPLCGGSDSAPHMLLRCNNLKKCT